MFPVFKVCPSIMESSPSDAAVAFQRVLNNQDTLSDVLSFLTAKELAPTRRVCCAMLQVADSQVPHRLAQIRAKLSVKTLPEASMALHALHLAEEYARGSELRNAISMYLDHIRVEAAMRGKLDEYQPRCDAIEGQFEPTTTREEFERLQAEAIAVEREIHTDMVHGLAILTLGPGPGTNGNEDLHAQPPGEGGGGCVIA